MGTAIIELINKSNIENVKVKTFGYDDIFVEHGKVEELEEKYGLTAEKIAKDISII